MGLKELVIVGVQMKIEYTLIYGLIFFMQGGLSVSRVCTVNIYGRNEI